MKFTKRNDLNTRERLQGSYPRGIFNPLGISDEFSFRNNFNDQKMHFIRTRKIFPHFHTDFSKGIISLQGNFYSAAVIHSLRRMNRDIPLGKNS